MNKKGQNEFIQNSKSKIKIKIYSDKCVSAAICILKAPKTFDLDEDGLAYVLEGEWDELADILDAAQSCSTQAIVIEDLNGNVIWPK